MKVLVSDSLSQNGVEILKNGGLDVTVKTGMTKDELKACIGEYDGIVIRSATKLTADVIEVANKLKVIGRAGSGLDNVDKIAASKKGIVVMNTPGGNTVTTAEHTIALMFALARKVPQANQSIAAGKWEKKQFMGVELFNKTLGIIGFGNIGRQVAKKAIGLEMNVLAFDPFVDEDTATELGVKKVTLDEIYASSDFITVHTSLNPETKNLINKDTIAKMKKGVRVINCARGGIVNEADIVEAIKGGKVAGAAFDVFEKEPPVDFDFLNLDQIIRTPHLGASTTEAQDNVALAVAEQIVDYLVNGTIRNAVNFPTISADQAPKIKPYASLAEVLGGFASQVFTGPVKEIVIELCGNAANFDAEPIKISALKGFLTPILEENVNFVNAPFIAKDRGIDVKVSKGEDAGDYHNKITLRIKSKEEEFTISGTLFGKKDHRIIQINDFYIEIVPEGTMLYVNNVDKPGVIGGIGTIFGNNKINISRMHFSREAMGGGALSVVNVDTDDISDDLLKKIKELPNITSVKVVKI
ncbi:MAG: phosphoglycerate dehydrogenase [Nitrospirae bacterium]|nr:phosphoglycerate dehydrogenase [Nitrospirota bacterium]MBF0539986.1 phosphoglycerate dehydrogenase [Nitrospirota bacterium]